MAMSHENCSHPRTPAGRAACRKAGGPGASAGSTPTPAHADGCISAPHKGRCIVKTVTPAVPTPRTPNKTKRDLKRPGTQIRAVADMADVPHAFATAIKSAHELGWVVRAGEPYNDTDRRIEIFGTHGTIMLVWSNTNPSGLQAFSFRPKDSSVATRTVSVSAAFVLAHDGVNAA